jgi:hypothetical protein
VSSDYLETKINCICNHSQGPPCVKESEALGCPLFTDESVAIILHPVFVVLFAGNLSENNLQTVHIIVNDGNVPLCGVRCFFGSLIPSEFESRRVWSILTHWLQLWERTQLLEEAQIWFYSFLIINTKKGNSYSELDRSSRSVEKN